MARSWMRRQTDKLEDVSVLESDPFTVRIRASVIRPREKNGGRGRWDRRMEPRWLRTRVSSFSRILGKYYRSTPEPRFFCAARRGVFMRNPRRSSPPHRFHIAVVGATAVGSTNFASFGHHSSPFSIRVFFRGQSTVSRGLTPRHWPSPYSLPFSFFDSDSLSPPCERDVRKGAGGSSKKL